MSNKTPTTEALGTVQVEAFSLPVSNLISQDSRRVIQDHAAYGEQCGQEFNAACEQRNCSSSIDLSKVGAEESARILKGQAESFYETQKYQDLRNIYDDVDISESQIAGINVEIFTPAEGISPANTDRVLINLHAGGFCYGFGTDTHEEAIPLAALGKIKVICPDYALSPQHSYPAANDDIVAVYRALLETYKPENIGILGCEAGAILSAQTIPRLNQENLPLPGAIGLFSAGAATELKGDSLLINTAVTGYSPGPLSYFAEADLNDPLVTPLNCDATLSTFPPTLLMTTVRDLGLSTVAYTHQQLVRVGVEADLHVWEGPEGWHLYHAPLAECREAYQVMVDFFDNHLA
ncbi:alpha/beta hydrolase [Porticoccaceae bacterium]|nr:alpha/beta hydrolase [Porticoccaceae bacterium]